MRRHRRHLDGLDEDIRDHIEREAQDNIDRGMSVEEARREALRKFGNVTLVKEDTRAVWISVWFDQLRQDTRYGWRMLRRDPAFTVVVILTIGIAIGMNTAVFSIVDAVLLRPLPYPDSERLVWLATNSRMGEAMASPDFFDWRDQAQSFERMAAYDTPDVSIATTDSAIRSRIAFVSDDFWKLSGVQPVLGRLPAPDDPNTLVITDRFYEQWFQRDPKVIGRAVTIDGRRVTISGILPKNYVFQFPLSLSASGIEADIDGYVPMILSAEDRLRGQSFTVMSVVGKLKPNVTIDEARAELEGVRSRVKQTSPTWFTNQAALRIVPLRDKLVGDAGKSLWILAGAVVFVLLIACVNVTNLLLGRASGRHIEMAIRTAVGAGRIRILRQCLVESIMLAFFASAAGVVLAKGGLAVILRLTPDAVPRLMQSSIDGRMLTFALTPPERDS
jgi:putative ABC transport system permease protein